MATEEPVGQADPEHGELAKLLEVLASPVRLSLLHRLARPSFVPDLARDLGMTRQALKKHLDALEGAGLLVSRAARRGALPATEYRTNPAGLFAFKEGVAALAVVMDPAQLPSFATLHAGAPGQGRAGARAAGVGLLLVHGDAAGRWFPLTGRTTWILGRDPKSDVPLGYDAFASARHAHLRLGPAGWTLTDLHSTNGTRVNFRPLAPGETVDVRAGDLLTVGRSHLLLRDGI